MERYCLLFVSLLAFIGCASTEKEQPAPLEAADVRFERAVVLAAFPARSRRDVEDIAVAELERRRPNAQVLASWKEFPDVESVTGESFRDYLVENDIDFVVTIVPFAETITASYDDWSDEAADELDDFVEQVNAGALAGRFGLEVVGWDVATRAPVCSRTSQFLVGDVAGPNGVAEFAVATVTRGF